MNYLRLLCGLPAALLLAACSQNYDKSHAPSIEQKTAIDTYLVNDIRDAAINNAILTQHTLYPYHFNVGRETLNELGDRDLAALAAYYRGKPGELNIRRGNATDDLYKARVDFVTKRLADSGVDTSRLKVSDAPSGGSGMPSESVVKIYQAMDKAAAEQAGSSKSIDQPAGYTGTQAGLEETPK